MKKFILCVSISVAALAATAQSAKNKTARKSAPKTNSNSTRPANSQQFSAASVGSYPAKANAYTIDDPTIQALNARANGADLRISNSGIVGMPKRAYGFANGHLTLYTTGATSSGTITGSGSVGTGSSLGNIGSYGPAIGMNGKSPYAGEQMWGNARGLWLPYGDSSVRRPRKKGQ